MGKVKKIVRPARPQILNSKGEPVLLNAREQFLARKTEKVVNSYGYEADITTLTTIVKEITTQKFFETPPAEFVPIRVGNGAWSQQLTTYVSFDVAGSFKKGLLNTGAGNPRLEAVESAIQPVNVMIKNWAKAQDWNIMDLQMASKSGNWDVVSAKEETRKRNWDLGIQEVAFLGLQDDDSVLGLLNQEGITQNGLDATGIIPGPISTLSGIDLKAFCATIVEAYRQNCQRTAWPTHFIIPEMDYNGLVGQASPQFPIKSTLEVLEDALKVATKNPNFKVLPLPYCMYQYNADLEGAGPDGANMFQYILLNYDPRSIRMDIPVDYTATLANTFNGFSFQNVGYGQFTGVQAYRPRELMYLYCPGVAQIVPSNS